MKGAHFPQSLGKVHTHVFLVITHTIIISKKRFNFVVVFLAFGRLLSFIFHKHK